MQPRLPRQRDALDRPPVQRKAQGGMGKAHLQILTLQHLALKRQHARRLAAHKLGIEIGIIGDNA
jgi:hypothetical protein